MNTPSENPEIKKITPLRLDMASATFLNGTYLGVLLAEINISTDEDGNIEPHVIRNLRKMLTVAATQFEQKGYNAYKKACLDFKAFLEEYDPEQ